MGQARSEPVDTNLLFSAPGTLGWDTFTTVRSWRHPVLCAWVLCVPSGALGQSTGAGLRGKGGQEPGLGQQSFNKRCGRVWGSGDTG